MRTLLVTNDFPPRAGGIQAYVHALAVRQPAGEMVVYASSFDGASADCAAFDAAQPFPVVRANTTMLLPTPAVLRQAREVARAEACDRVWFGAAAPLGLLAHGLRLPRAVASSYGHEVGWAMLPGARQLLSRIGRDVDVVTYLAEYTHARLASALRRTTMVPLPSGVDTRVFTPDAGAGEVRARLGLMSRPVIVCVSRLVPRKGQDVLIQALPLVQQRVPEAALLIVGGGPSLRRLRQQADSLGVAEDVVLTGTVPAEELPSYYAAGDVFAMPCRSRFGGLEVEGLGIVFLEAAAAGLPVVAGLSGGSPDTVLDGVTGYLVDGTAVASVAARICSLLEDPERAAQMGAAGREWMQREWRWEVLAGRLRALLDGEQSA